MQFGTTIRKLSQNGFDASLDGRMICAVASDKFLNNCPKRRWRKFRVRDKHRHSLQDESQINRFWSVASRAKFLYF